MTDELIEIVDDNDQVTGTMLRSEAAKENLLHFRAIYVWLVNSKGELYLPVRASHKKLYPGGYDFSVAGQVGVGESYEDAFFRETQEELRFDARKYTWREVAKLTPTKNGTACFVKLYEVRADIEPDFNRDDIESVQWLTPKQALFNMYHGQYYKTDIPMTLRLFYDYTK